MTCLERGFLILSFSLSVSLLLLSCGCESKKLGRWKSFVIRDLRKWEVWKFLCKTWQTCQLCKFQGNDEETTLKETKSDDKCAEPLNCMWTLLAQIHNKSNDGEIMSLFFFSFKFHFVCIPQLLPFLLFWEVWCCCFWQNDATETRWVILQTCITKIWIINVYIWSKVEEELKS